MTQGLMRLKLPIQDLVEEILNQLPDQVWQDPHIMFLDPAMAGGQFIRAIERRLLAAGHSKENIADRVYGCEEKLIRVKYVQNWHKVLSNHLQVMDFITHDWGNMKFDVIVGNPPYQSEKGNNRLGSRGDTSLWPKFVHKSLALLKPNGYMCMLHPTSWRKPDERYGLWNKLTREHTMTKMVMRSGKGAQDNFGIGVRFDWYVIVNALPNAETVTQVVDHEDVSHSLNLKNWSWLPNYAIEEIKAILGTGCEVVYNTQYHTQKEHGLNKSKKFKWPVVHTINKDGLGVRYFDKADTSGQVHFGKAKVLLNQNEIQYPYNDYKGEYGMSQLTFGIGIKNKQEGDKIVEFLNSEKGKRIIAATKWNTFYTDYGMFEHFKKDWYNA